MPEPRPAIPTELKPSVLVEAGHRCGARLAMILAGAGTAVAGAAGYAALRVVWPWD